MNSSTLRLLSVVSIVLGIVSTTAIAVCFTVGESMSDVIEYVLVVVALLSLLVSVIIVKWISDYNRYN